MSWLFPGPRAHQAGTRRLLQALVGALPPEIDALWEASLPEQVAPEENSLKYDVYLTMGPQPAWGLAWNPRWGDAAADRRTLRRYLGEDLDWALAEQFVARLPGTQTLALGYGGEKPRVKIYQQEDPWGQGICTGPALAALGDWLGLPVPAWVADWPQIGVITLELLPGGGRRLKAYLGAATPDAFAAQAPELLPAMRACSTQGAWFYLTIRMDPGGVRTALNKIYNPMQTRDPAQAWADVARLFAHAGASLSRLEAIKQAHPELLLLPTATAVEDAGRSVDVYLAAWLAPPPPSPAVRWDIAQVDAVVRAWCGSEWTFEATTAEQDALLVQVRGPTGALRLRVQAVGVGPAMLRGERLQVVALHTAGQPTKADALARALVAAEEKIVH